jgi:hypothetical protein
MDKCKIGADELILWLRKNNIANKIPNDGISGLGIKIHDIIVIQLSGQKIEDNVQSYWANIDTDKNIGKYNLPKTSAQYLIAFDKLSELYVKLSEIDI